MKAVWKLLSLPFRQMALAAWLLLLGFIGISVALAITGLAPLMVVLALIIWFWHILGGASLRSVLRAEVLLLPRFRLRLVQAAAVDVAITIVLPVLMLLTLTQGQAHYAPMAAGGLLLVAALGLAAGTGMRAMLLFGVIFIVAGWLPGLAGMISRTAMHSLLTPVALTLTAALVTSLALRPLLTVSDREITESPLGTALGGNRPGLGKSATSRPRGKITQRINGLFESTAEKTLRGALHRYRRSPGARNRMALIRAVLLPHDNPRAVLFQIVMIGTLGTAYFFATHAAQRWDATYVGAYAVIIGLSRFASAGRGLVRMRANLAELYMTLAPRTRREFQAILADALLWLVGVAVFNCLVYAALIALLLHAHEPSRLILAALISGVAGALGSLSAYLIGPESTGGSIIMRLVLMTATVGVYALVYWLLGRFGLGLGGVLALVLTLPFGIGAWQAARREYLQRNPRFDIPL